MREKFLVFGPPLSGAWPVRNVPGIFYMFKEGDALSRRGAVEGYLDSGGRTYDIERARARTLERHDPRRIREFYETIDLGASRG